GGLQDHGVDRLCVGRGGSSDRLGASGQQLWRGPGVAVRDLPDDRVHDQPRPGEVRFPQPQGRGRV
ncbi:MAG: hypothetical protein AVDCRST_MAG01-01-3610, partial [uncultured Rubrobacteraceae bacterium]